MFDLRLDVIEDGERFEIVPALEIGDHDGEARRDFLGDGFGAGENAPADRRLSFRCIVFRRFRGRIRLLRSTNFLAWGARFLLAWDNVWKDSFLLLEQEQEGAHPLDFALDAVKAAERRKMASRVEVVCNRLEPCQELPIDRFRTVENPVADRLVGIGWFRLRGGFGHAGITSFRREWSIAQLPA